MFTVVLTGGVGSGKSAASAYFADLGVSIIDADLVSRDLVIPGSPALQQIVAAFGHQVLTLDGTLDRAMLRDRIFREPSERARLEAILHPLIRQGILQQHAAATEPYAMLVIPLWPVDQAQYPVDRVLLIDVPTEVQIARVQQRDQLDAAAVDRMLASQCSRAARLAVADDVILNTGSSADLEVAVQAQHAIYLQQAANKLGV